MNYLNCVSIMSLMLTNLLFNLYSISDNVSNLLWGGLVLKM